MTDPLVLNQRQMLYWRLIAATSGLEEAGASFERMAAELADDLGLPPAIVDATLGIDVLLHRYPRLKVHFDAIQHHIQAPEDDAVAEGAATVPGGDDVDLRRTFAYSK